MNLIISRDANNFRAKLYPSQFIIDEGQMCFGAVAECDLIDSVFGDDDQEEDVDSMITHAIELTEAIERVCPKNRFAKYYISLSGRV